MGFSDTKQTLSVPSGAPTSKKRGHQASPVVQEAHEDPKGRLMRVVTLLLGRSATKSDVEYTHTEAEGGGFAASVAIPESEYNDAQSFDAPLAETKKQAEQLAAAEALAHLEELVAPLEAEHVANKQAAKEAKMQAFREKRQRTT